MTKTYKISGPDDEVAVASLADELSMVEGAHEVDILSLIHISEPTRLSLVSRMPSSA